MKLMSWALLETAFLPKHRPVTQFILENIKKDENPEIVSKVQEALELQYQSLFKVEIDEDAEEVINEYADCLKCYRKVYLERMKAINARAMKAGN